MLITVASAIFVFGLLIVVHELGHFISAKMVGMRVDEFALGFGPEVFSFKKGETLYSLRLIPLGGYNKIAGMDPEEELDERSYNSKPIWARMFVIIAGSAMNLLLPVFLFMIVFLTAGIDMPATEPVIGSLMENKPAAVAGIMPGDKVLAVNGVNVDSWMQFVKLVQDNGTNSLNLVFERNGIQQSVVLQPEYDQAANRAIVGVIPNIYKYYPGVFESFSKSVEQTWKLTGLMLSGLQQMITGKVAAEVAGPIGVAQMAGQVAQFGFLPLLSFAAFLSINLGIINMLPVPVLDGGHVVALVVEGLRGKPLSPEKMRFIQVIGLSLLLLLLIVATFSDINRLNLM